MQGPWITGNKFYAGSGAIVGYLPAKKLAIAVITTYRQAAFDSHGDVTDAGPRSCRLWRKPWRLPTPSRANSILRPPPASPGPPVKVISSRAGIWVRLRRLLGACRQGAA